jgi:hypothetical protein
MWAQRLRVLKQATILVGASVRLETSALSSAETWAMSKSMV